MRAISPNSRIGFRQKRLKIKVTGDDKYKAISPLKRKRGGLMKTFSAFVQTVLLLVIASAANSQSLADLANKEKERRQEIKNDRVITEEDAAKYRTEAPATGSPEQPAVAADSEKKDTSKVDKPVSDEPVDFQGRPESYWRETMAAARQKVKDLENEANVIVLRITSLQNQFYSEDNGFKREGIQREIQKSFYDQDKNKQDLATARDALQDLEKEARKSGALPGWLGK